VFGPARARLVWSPLHHLWRKPLPPSLPLFSIPFHQTTTCRLAQPIKRRPFVSLRTLLHILLLNASALIFNRLCASFSYAVAPISGDSLDPTPSALLLQLDHEPNRTALYSLFPLFNHHDLSSLSCVNLQAFGTTDLSSFHHTSHSLQDVQQARPKSR
jgi:hypothetical protein